MKTSHTIFVQLLCCIALCSLSSCMKYQYATMHSNLDQTKNKEFISENDSVKVVYSFNGENLPIYLTVYNKLDRPMYVDWKMSSIIIGGRSFTYKDDLAAIEMSGTSQGFNHTDSYSASTQTLSGSMILPVQVSFIPPLSHFKTYTQDLKSRPFETTDPGKKTTMYTSSGFAEKRVMHSYSEKDSPLQFRSYLTLSCERNFATSFTMTGDFWVGKLFNSGQSPSVYHPKTNGGDTFYMRKPTAFGAFMALLGIAGLVILSTGAE